MLHRRVILFLCLLFVGSSIYGQNSTLQKLIEIAQRTPSAANLRAVADAYMRLADYDNAWKYYEQAIARYRQLGQAANADALLEQTQVYRSEFSLYTLEPAQPDPNQKLAKFEPPVGVYLGAYVEEEGEIGQNKMFRMTFVFGGNHAVYFRYHFLVQPGTETENRPLFQDKFVYVARNSAAAVHIALEPKVPLSEITEDTIRPFAEAARDAEIPIFVRFASEFNDRNNPWSGNPKLYIDKWRLVTKVFREVAPNVAMVWSAQALPTSVIDQYYPGKDWVDWVGVTTYSTIFVNGDPKQPGDRINPLDRLDYIYQRYSKDHPIQVSEYAAEHKNGALGDKDFSELAATKMRMMYWGVYMRYPRVKNINWFSSDTTQDHPRYNQMPPARRRNYSLIESPLLVNTYKEFMQNPYFLQYTLRPGETLETLPDVPKPFPKSLWRSDKPIKGVAWIKIYEPYIAKVEYRLNRKLIGSPTVLPYGFEITPESLVSGINHLQVTAFDHAGKVLLQREVVFNVQ